MSFMFRPRKGHQDSLSDRNCGRRRFDDRLSLRAQRREDQFRKRRKLRESSEVSVENVAVENLNAMADPDTKLSAVANLRKYLCLDTSDVKQVVEKGYVSILLQILRTADTSLLKMESAWCISNISAGDASCASEIVKGGGIPIMLQMLQQETREDLLDHVLTCLGNLAADNVTYRQQILALNGCNLLFNIYASHAEQLELILNTSWVLAMIVQSEITPKQMGICLALCQQLLKIDNDDLWTQAIWIVRNLFHDLKTLENFIPPLVTSGILSGVVDIIDYPREEIRLACLVCCQHLLRVEDLIPHLLDAGLLQKIREVLQDTDPQFDSVTKKYLQIESLRTLSFVPYSKESVESILKLDIVRKIFELAKSGSFEIKRESLNVILALLECGSIKQVQLIVGFGVMHFIRQQMILEHPQLDDFCLQCIHTILEVGQISCKNSAKNPYCVQCENSGILIQVLRLSNSAVEELRDFADHLLSYLEGGHQV